MDTRNVRISLRPKGKSVPMSEPEPGTWMVDAKYRDPLSVSIQNLTAGPLEIAVAMHGIDLLGVQLVERPRSLIRGWIVPAGCVLDSRILPPLFVGHFCEEIQARVEAAHIQGDSLRHGLLIQVFQPYSPGFVDQLKGAMAVTCNVFEVRVASGFWPRQGKLLERVHIMFVQMMH